MSISNKTWETIREKDIQPSPRWRFLLKDWVLFFFGALSILAGSIAVSVSLLLFQHFDWDVAAFSRRGPVIEIFSAIPHVWLGILVLFVGVAYYQMRHTHSGYRYRGYVFVLVSVGASLALGMVFFSLGFGHRVDALLSGNIPQYNRLIQRPVDRWVHPERGLLAGTIVHITKDSAVIEDFSGRRWSVRLPKEHMNTAVIGSRIKLFGESKEREFMVNRISSWIDRDPPRMFFRRNHGRE
jgi:hypothetical protein